MELAKNWRTDKYLRKLEATMIVADKHHMFQITGNGDVLEPSNGIIGIGSGGSYALAASKALVDVEGLNAMDIAKKAMDEGCRRRTRRMKMRRYNTCLLLLLPLLLLLLLWDCCCHSLSLSLSLFTMAAVSSSLSS